MTKDLYQLYMTVLKWKWGLFQDGKEIRLMNSKGLFAYALFLITDTGIVVKNAVWRKKLRNFMFTR